MAAPKGLGVFTLPASAHFAESLARGLQMRAGSDPLALSSAIIYLPTRRAARGFGDAFARVLGGAALLPQFRALGDSEDDELLFSAPDEDLDLRPAIKPLRRQLLLARLIRHWDAQWEHEGREGALSFAQAAALADSLAKVMDEVETQGCDLSKLKEMLPQDLAEHWQGVTRFLDVLHDQWPAVLAAEQALNPAHRRALAMQALGKRLAAGPQTGWVIAAGSTGSIPATADLLGVIARLPRGAVVLPGLDRELDEESWRELDPGHPQFGLRELLKRMDCDRAEVKDWTAADRNAPREMLLRETLRPAPTTDAWRALAAKGGGAVTAGLKDLSLAVCADPAQEALAIALALRHALENEGRTAALVTPDRNLARRVAAEMRRWGVGIDDSAGRPLAHTAAGSFLCLAAEAAEARFAPVPLLALLKHPFALAGQDSASFRARARELDRWCLRGPRPDPGLAGIARAIAKAGQVRRPPPARALADLARWWDGIAEILAPLEKIFTRDGATITALLEAHGAAAEALARDENKMERLWQGPDGEVAAELIAALKTAAQGLDPIEPGSWPPLLRNLAMKTPVRPGFGRHPRLFILGPLEARLQRFDLTVLGGLNEGAWPQGAGTDPWFSRPMRAGLGLEQPERNIGLAAHDFAALAAGPCVLLTRALKADGAPTIPSRWLQRLEQLVLGLDADKEKKIEDVLRSPSDFAGLAARMAAVPPGPRLSRPAPTPPVSARPRELSVTEIETWLRDPYAIYAKHVLRLRPLNALDEEVGPLERGNALHKALELFVQEYPAALPPDAAQQLARIADDVFAQAAIPKAALAVWRPRFLAAAQGFLEIEAERRAALATPHLERRGKLTIAADGGDFILSGVADRIDVLKDGKAEILDYKTGRVPSRKQVAQLLSPQLPLEAAILAAGGFEGIGPHETSEMVYLSLADGKKARQPVFIADAPALAAQAVAQLKRLVDLFDRAGTPYLPHVQPLYTDSAGDYDHLARLREWSSSGGDDA